MKILKIFYILIVVITWSQAWCQTQHYSFSAYDLKDPLDAIYIAPGSQLAVPSAYDIQVTGHSRGMLFLPVHLPDGARINRIRIHYKDNHSGANARISVDWVADPHGSSRNAIYTDVFDSYDSHPSPRMADVRPTLAPINNENSAYYLRFLCSRHNETLGVLSGIISYTLP